MIFYEIIKLLWFPPFLPTHNLESTVSPILDKRIISTSEVGV